MKKIIFTLFLLIFISSCNLSQEKINKNSISSGNIEQTNTWENLEITNSWTEEDEENTEFSTLEKISKKWENTEFSLQKTEKWFCVLDFCAPKDSKFKEKKWFLVAINKMKDEYGDEYDATFTFDKKNKIFLRSNDYQMGFYNSSISLIDWYYFVKNNSWGCWWNTYSQEFFDKNGKSINYFPEFLKNIKIGEVEYEPKISFKNLGNSVLDKTKYEFFEEKKDWEYESVKFENLEDFKNKILKSLIERPLYQNYFASFKNYPDLTVYFQAKNYKQSIKTIFPDSDPKIAKNWDLFDLDLSKELYGDYDIENKQPREMIVKKWWEEVYWNWLKWIKKEDLPVFNLKKTELKKDWKNGYFVYMSDKYELQSLAELCKPLVYYYSKNPVKNSLTLNLKWNDYFTKIIPDFTTKNTWDFSVKLWEINVLDKNFEYLYYSMANVWYKHNEDWWIVSGKDIVSFFEDKLEKINFLPKEKQDFIDFWKYLYKKDKYYFVSFKYKEDLDKIVKLDFSRQPDKIFRVLLDSYELPWLSSEKKYFLYDKNDKEKFDKNLIKRFERWNSNEEVFEWWWVLETDNKKYVK